MALLDTVKIAKRIRHPRLDDEIRRHIATAKAELIRVGVDENVVKDGGDLVEEAIVTFCLMKLADDPKERDDLGEAFRIQVDNLRKSPPREADPEEAEES